MLNEAFFVLKVQLKYPFDSMDAYLTNDTVFLTAFATSVFLGALRFRSDDLMA